MKQMRQRRKKETGLGPGKAGASTPADVSSHRTARSYFGASALVCLILVVGSSVILHIDSIGHGFVYDDQSAIKDNKDVRQGAPLSNLLLHDFWGDRMDSSESHKSYRPLTVLTFRLNSASSGGGGGGGGGSGEMEPRSFHVTNVAVHAAVCGTLFVLTMIVSYGDVALATAAGLFYAAHPVHVESVANLVGRAELLYSLFFLAALIVAAVARQREQQQLQQPWYLAAELLLLVLLGISSGLSKEMGLTLPGVLLVQEAPIVVPRLLPLLPAFLTCGRARYHRSEALPPLAPALYRLGASVVAVAGVLSLRASVSGEALTPSIPWRDNPIQHHPSTLVRTMSYAHQHAWSLGLLLWPSTLRADYAPRLCTAVESVADMRNLGSAAAYTGICVAILMLWCALLEPYNPTVATTQAFVGKGKSKGKDKDVSSMVSTGSLWQRLTCCHGAGNTSTSFTALLALGLSLLVVPFIPASNLISPVGFQIAERVLYLPSAGVCVLAALLLRVLCNASFGVGMTDKASGDSRVPATASVVLILCAVTLCTPLGVKTLERVPVWASDATLWDADFKTSSASNQVVANYAYYTLLGSWRDPDTLTTETLVHAGKLLVNSTSVSIDVGEDFDAFKQVISRLMRTGAKGEARQLMLAWVQMLQDHWPSALPRSVWEGEYDKAPYHPLLGDQLSTLAAVENALGNRDAVGEALRRAIEVNPRDAPTYRERLSSLGLAQ